ncbi:hypothetical protein F5Y14DRAFT_417565 [Nemania sp. NC0429]|nr:hypothetical protein F5Y14DRAFT_417565 [Nemania sp. NC0429]
MPDDTMLASTAFTICLLGSLTLGLPLSSRDDAPLSLPGNSTAPFPLPGQIQGTVRDTTAPSTIPGLRQGVFIAIILVVVVTVNFLLLLVIDHLLFDRRGGICSCFRRKAHPVDPSRQ